VQTKHHEAFERTLLLNKLVVHLDAPLMSLTLEICEDPTSEEFRPPELCKSFGQ
jgi:hypothetical protein